MNKTRTPISENYNHTIYASYIGYIVQAIVNNFAPLLFLTFSAQFSLSLDKITLITTINFAVQLAVDLISAKLIDKIGYRISIVAAHVFAAAGLICLSVLPWIFSNQYVGIVISVVLYAIGGGLTEVLISPIVEACPVESKKGSISLLHSFYCWGQFGVILLSTLFFTVFGIEHWRILSLIWAAVPIANGFYYAKVPLYPISKSETPSRISQLFKNKLFWLILLLMLCAGASELAMAQWASAFAESALHVSKTVGDLAGPCAFALLMGSARAIYGKFSDRLPLKKAIMWCAVLCIASYLLASLTSLPVFGLIGCAVCGFSVGIFWPGIYCLSTASIPAAGTAIYAFMALAGDVGCMSGPTLVGFFANSFGANLKLGLITAVIFPATILVGSIFIGKKKS